MFPDNVERIPELRLDARHDPGRPEIFGASGFSARARKIAPGAGALPKRNRNGIQPNPAYSKQKMNR
jgi:hypothetical protein